MFLVQAPAYYFHDIFRIILKLSDITKILVLQVYIFTHWKHFLTPYTTFLTLEKEQTDMYYFLNLEKGQQTYTTF
jgi:hypothetical protein